MVVLLGSGEQVGDGGGIGALQHQSGGPDGAGVLPDRRHLHPRSADMPVSIYTFFGQYGTVPHGQLAAYSILYSVPVVVLYILVSKVLGGAFNLAGAVKG